MCVFGWGALETQNGTSFVEVFFVGGPPSSISPDRVQIDESLSHHDFWGGHGAVNDLPFVAV